MSVELTVDPGATSFSGKVEISLSFAEPLGFIWLNAKALTVSSAEIVAGDRTIPALVFPGPPEHVGFGFPRPIPPGNARLRVSYSGPLSDQMSSGLYLQRSGQEPMAFTQLESQGARRVFPCFDEPSFKIPWQLTLRVPRDLDAMTGTAPVSQTDDGQWKRVVFARTPPLPSYLLAVVVGKLARVEAGRAGRRPTPLGIVVPAGHEPEAAFAASVFPDLVRRLEDYFDVPFPYDKLDNAARPDGRGAMENAGLIISGGGTLIAAPARASAAFRKASTATAAHEIAHQWFGDLVTTAWWDDIWLNEAFATWLAAKVYAVRPEFRPETERADDRQKALLADLLPSARRIRQPIETRGDIGNAFDAITYQKGASVLRMFERFIGEEPFRAGVHAYLLEHANGNATTADFVAAIEKAAGRPVAPAFASFVDQPGFPEVTVELRCDGKPRVAVSQRRYVPLGRDPGGARWTFPVCVRGASCILLGEASAEIPLASCPKFVLANDQSGYYIATYGDAGWAALVAAGRELGLEEQLAVVTDARVGLTAGRLSADRVVGLVEAWVPDAGPELTVALVELARTLPERGLVADDARPAFGAWVTRVFGARARALGWKARPDDTDPLRILRRHLLAFVALHGDDPRPAAEARALATAWLTDRGAVDPDALEGVLETAAWTGDAVFAAGVRAARGDDAVERQLLVKTLFAFGREDGFARAAEAWLGEIHPRDFRYLRATLPDSPAAPRIFRFVTEHFDALAARIPEDNRDILLHAGSGLCSAADARAYDAFFRPRAAQIFGGPRTFAQQLEEIEICAAARAAVTWSPRGARSG